MNGFHAKIDVIVGMNIKAAREALGWKQSELAERTELGRSTIAKIETGGTITVSTLSTIAEALGIPPYMLMLRSVDWKRLANIATCQSKIERYRSSGQSVISPVEVERIQEMSASPIKSERRKAIHETNAVIAQIFGFENHSDGPVIQEVEKSRTAGTGIATSMLPTYPILNGLIANLITA